MMAARVVMSAQLSHQHGCEDRCSNRGIQWIRKRSCFGLGPHLLWHLRPTGHSSRRRERHTRDSVHLACQSTWCSGDRCKSRSAGRGSPLRSSRRPRRPHRCRLGTESSCRSTCSNASLSWSPNGASSPSPARESQRWRSSHSSPHADRPCRTFCTRSRASRRAGGRSQRRRWCTAPSRQQSAGRTRTQGSWYYPETADSRPHGMACTCCSPCRLETNQNRRRYTECSAWNPRMRPRRSDGSRWPALPAGTHQRRN
jgi:hypothetical protein